MARSKKRSSLGESSRRAKRRKYHGAGHDGNASPVEAAENDNDIDEIDGRDKENDQVLAQALYLEQSNGQSIVDYGLRGRGEENSGDNKGSEKHPINRSLAARIEYSPLPAAPVGATNDDPEDLVLHDDEETTITWPLAGSISSLLNVAENPGDIEGVASHTFSISVPEVSAESVAPPGPRGGSSSTCARNSTKRRKMTSNSKDRAPVEVADQVDAANGDSSPSPVPTEQAGLNTDNGQDVIMRDAAVDTRSEQGENDAQNMETDVNNDGVDNSNIDGSKNMRSILAPIVNDRKDAKDSNVDRGGASDSEQPQRKSCEVLFRFPPVGRGGITLRYEDYDRLNKWEYLNDSLIDFYIKFIEMERANMSTPHDAERPTGKPYFFSSFFYTKLRPNTALPWSEIDYDGVKRWTAGVDLFEKELIFMPICHDNHWSLIIIVNLNEMQACLDDETRFDRLENNKKPRILYFDSLEPKHGPSFGKMVVHYLAAEYYERKVDQDESDNAESVYAAMSENINIDWPNVPRQINEVDGGLYMLHNISCFIDESTSLRKVCLRGPKCKGKIKRQVQIKQFYAHSEIHNLREYMLLLIMELEKGGVTHEGQAMDQEVLAENHPAIFPPKELPISVPMPTVSLAPSTPRVESVFEDQERAGLEDSYTGVRSKSAYSPPPPLEIPPSWAYGSGAISVPLPRQRTRAGGHGGNLRSQSGGQAAAYQFQPRRSTRSSARTNPRHATSINSTTPEKQDSCTGVGGGQRPPGSAYGRSKSNSRKSLPPRKRSQAAVIVKSSRPASGVGRSSGVTKPRRSTRSSARAPSNTNTPPEKEADENGNGNETPSCHIQRIYDMVGAPGDRRSSAQEVGEDAMRVLAQAVSNERGNVIRNSGHLLRHLCRLWADMGVTPSEIFAEVSSSEAHE